MTPRSGDVATPGDGDRSEAIARLAGKVFGIRHAPRVATPRGSRLSVGSARDDKLNHMPMRLLISRP
jgi:hypothetical protein